MADQSDQQSPPAPTQAPQAPAPTPTTSVLAGGVPIQANVPPAVAPAQQPAPTVTPAVQTVSQAVETKVEQTFSSVVKDLWAKYGILFVLIGLGLAILKFNDAIMDVLGWSSKKDLQSTMKTDAQLKAQEDATNNQADVLVKDAEELPGKEGAVDDDWDKK
jgi:hypothetical protein